ncbi:hypothetical protein GYMLUDRAFT_356941 [Collybiopsis luxurians FD-317 M1]|nr:hypothetical protein GYMLUDRAFT_356941 [Collybiopsis luxurians FD-317 M1]
MLLRFQKPQRVQFGCSRVQQRSMQRYWSNVVFSPEAKSFRTRSSDGLGSAIGNL